MMFKAIISLTILYCFISEGPSGEAICLRNFNYYPNGLMHATGNVIATGRNSIEIYDEDLKKDESFVNLDQDKLYHQGDYVRIYYYPQGSIVAAIKRMTVFAYKKNDQNLGYISRN
jgi:hypothetical protein